MTILISLRRRALLAAAISSAALALAAQPAQADSRAHPSVQPAAAAASTDWVASWGTAPAGPPIAQELQTFSDQTLRLIVHTSVGGNHVRVRLSNVFGTAPLHIGAAHVALRQSGADIVEGSDRVLTFSGMKDITIAPGAPVLSDPIELDVAALSDLAVSVYLPEPAQASTVHGGAYQTNYVSQPGDHTASAALPTARTLGAWPFLTEVEVTPASRGSAIVAFGDSITDGAVTTSDANRRWPDLLAVRLQEAARGGNVAGKRAGKVAGKSADYAAVRIAGTGATGSLGTLGVVNRGIGGNRLMRDPGTVPMFGKAALARFDRDVLATAGIRHVIVLLGINDIGQPGTDSATPAEAVNADAVIGAHRQLIARAHAKGLRIIGATLTPFEGTVFPGYYSAEKEAIRNTVNSWIRSGGEYDGVIDFDHATRDPAAPTRMLAAYDSGDHLHPNDKGMQAMADAIDLSLFTTQPASPAARHGKVHHAHAAAH